MKLKEKTMKAQENMEMMRSIMPKLTREIEHYEWYALRIMRDMKHLGKDLLMIPIEELKLNIRNPRLAVVRSFDDTY